MTVLFRRFGYYLLFVYLPHIQQCKCENATEVSNDTLRDILPNQKITDELRSTAYNYEKHDAIFKRDLKDFHALDNIHMTLPFNKISDKPYEMNDKHMLSHNNIIGKAFKRNGTVEDYTHKFMEVPLNLNPYSRKDKKTTSGMQWLQPKFDGMNSFTEIRTILPTELRMDKNVNNWLPVYRSLMRTKEQAGKSDALVNLGDEPQLQNSLKSDLKGALNNNNINDFDVTPVTPKHFLSFKDMGLAYPSNAKGNDRNDNSLKNGQPVFYKVQNSFFNGEQQNPSKLSQATSNDVDQNTNGLITFHSNKDPENITEIKNLKISRNIVPASSAILDSAEDPSVKLVDKVGKENYELLGEDEKLNSFLKLPRVKSQTMYFFNPHSSYRDNPKRNETNSRKMAMKEDSDKSNYVLRNLNISNEFKAVVAFKDYPPKFHEEFIHFNFASNESTESSNNVQKLYSRLNDINAFQNLHSVVQLNPVVNDFAKIRLQNLRLPNRMGYLHKIFSTVTNSKGKPHVQEILRKNMKNIENNDTDNDLPINLIANEKTGDLNDRKIYYLGTAKDSNRKENLRSFQPNSYGIQNFLHYSSQNQPFLSSHLTDSNLNNIPTLYSYKNPRDIGKFTSVSNSKISFSLPKSIKFIFKEKLSSKPVAISAREVFEPISKNDHFGSSSRILHDKIDTMFSGGYPIYDDHPKGHLGNTKEVPRDENSGESNRRENKLAMGKLSYISNNKIYNKALPPDLSVPWFLYMNCSRDRCVFTNTTNEAELIDEGWVLHNCTSSGCSEMYPKPSSIRKILGLSLLMFFFSILVIAGFILIFYYCHHIHLPKSDPKSENLSSSLEESPSEELLKLLNQHREDEENFYHSDVKFHVKDYVETFVK